MRILLEFDGCVGHGIVEDIAIKEVAVHGLRGTVHAFVDVEILYHIDGVAQQFGRQETAALI